MTENPTRLHRAAIIAMIFGAMALGGCTSGKDSPVLSTDGYPLSSVAASAADPIYRDLLATVDRVLTTTGGTAPLGEPRISEGGCVPDGSATAYGYLVSTPDPVTDDRWPRVVEELRTELQAEGFTEFTTIRDAPGAHDVAYGRADGVKLVIGTGKATALTLESACHPDDPSTLGAS